MDNIIKKTVNVEIGDVLVFAEGVPGTSASIDSVEAVTLPAGSEATAENLGTNLHAHLRLGIPKGVSGNESIDDFRGIGDTDYVWSAGRISNSLYALSNKMVWEQGGWVMSSGVPTGAGYASNARIRARLFFPVDGVASIIKESGAAAYSIDIRRSDGTALRGNFDVQANEIVYMYMYKTGASSANVSPSIGAYIKLNYCPSVESVAKDSTQRTTPMLVQGGIYSETGLPYSISTKVRSRKIYAYRKAFTISYSGNKTNIIYWMVLYDKSGDFISFRSVTSSYLRDNITECFPDNVGYVIFVFGLSTGADLGVSDLDGLEIFCDSFENKKEITVSKATDFLIERTGSYPVGSTVRTKGFNSEGDNGEAVYKVFSSTAELTANSITVFTDANGNFLSRVYDKPYLYLESLDVENKSWSTVNDLVIASGITDVRADKLNMDHAITITSYNFTFDSIISTANGALRLVDIRHKKIIGRYLECISSDSGIPLVITNDTTHVDYNLIDIREIYASDICVYINPRNGKGIYDNDYIFGFLHGYRYSGGTGPRAGIMHSISAARDGGGDIILDDNGLPLYSFEGEDRFSINRITVTNVRTVNGVQTYGTAKAISMSIETALQNFVEGKQDYGTSVFGTITGLTYSNLSVEGSDIGLHMRCGERSPYSSSRFDSGIKSIVIDNLRVREAVQYFDMVGYFRDIYIKPTSKLNLQKIGYKLTSEETHHHGIEYNADNDTYIYPILNRSQQYVTIDCPIFVPDSYAGMRSYAEGEGIGTKLIATNSKIFIATPTNYSVIVTSDPDTYANTRTPIPVELIDNEYVVKEFYNNRYPCTKYFYIADDLSGTAVSPNTVVLDLREYYRSDFGNGIHISVPAYCSVNVKLEGENKICESDSERKFYCFKNFYKRLSKASSGFVVFEEKEAMSDY